MNTKTVSSDKVSLELITTSGIITRRKSSSKSGAGSFSKIKFQAHSFTELVQYLNQKEQEFILPSK